MKLFHVPGQNDDSSELFITNLAAVFLGISCMMRGSMIHQCRSRSEGLQTVLTADFLLCIVLTSHVLLQRLVVNETFVANTASQNDSGMLLLSMFE